MGQKYLAEIAGAQASAAATADTFSAGAQTVIDSVAVSANAEGCTDLAIELDVTVAPSTATSVDVYKEESIDGTNYGEPKYVCTLSNVGTSAQEYTEEIKVTAPFMKLKWKPIGYNMTAVLNVRPIYHA